MSARRLRLQGEQTVVVELSKSRLEVAFVGVIQVDDPGKLDEPAHEQACVLTTRATLEAGTDDSLGDKSSELWVFERDATLERGDVVVLGELARFDNLIPKHCPSLPEPLQYVSSITSSESATRSSPRDLLGSRTNAPPGDVGKDDEGQEIPDARDAHLAVRERTERGEFTP